MLKEEVINAGRKQLEKQHLPLHLANHLYTDLFGQTKKLNNDEVIKYQTALQEILNGRPLQYVTGKAPFYGYEFHVNQHVLIPRFETEQLVFYTLRYINKYFNQPITIVDIGTGCGNIAITLKKERPSLRVWGTDLSKEAIITASNNAKKLGVNVPFLVGDMLKPLMGKKFDVVISNPPYLKKDEDIAEEVRKNEPAIALFGGNDGLKYYRKMFIDLPKILKPSFLIALEVSEIIIKDLIKLVWETFPDSKYVIKEDLLGRIRMLFIYHNID